MKSLLTHPAALCTIVRRIAVEAGDRILRISEQEGGMVMIEKEDGTPVTKADREAELFIKRALRELTPDIPFVGEEGVSSGLQPNIVNHDYCWFVDPLDGTCEFASGGKDFTVNIGLVLKGKPVLGVIYAPALGELYAGFGEGTAIRWTSDTGRDRPIRVRRPPREGITVMASRCRGREHLDLYLENRKVERIVRRSSSLKICEVASGKADLYPSFDVTCEWDTAAGHAILNAAGGELVDTQGKELSYGKGDPFFLNPHFIARSIYLDLESVRADTEEEQRQALLKA